MNKIQQVKIIEQYKLDWETFVLILKGVDNRNNFMAGQHIKIRLGNELQIIIRKQFLINEVNEKKQIKIVYKVDDLDTEQLSLKNRGEYLTILEKVEDAFSIKHA